MKEKQMVNYTRMWWCVAVAVLLVVLLLTYVIPFAIHSVSFLRRHYCLRQLDLARRYGAGSVVCITGASSGQGLEMARCFAEQGFGLLLIGSVRTHGAADDIRRRWNVPVTVLVKDFSRCFESEFFQDIDQAVDSLDVSVMVNNVGHRTGWIPYHDQPDQVMRNTIACGTLVQCHLTKTALRRFARRRLERANQGLAELHTALVFITAQCIHSTVGLGILESNEITVPYLSVYEPTNAFGYFHACSIYEEYRDDPTIDILNITPGAVVTSNTCYLRRTIFSVSARRFAQNVVRLLGNYQGTTCAAPGHSLSCALAACFPWIKRRTLRRVGRTIADDYMKRYRAGDHNKYDTNTRPRRDPNPPCQSRTNSFSLRGV